MGRGWWRRNQPQPQPQPGLSRSRTAPARAAPSSLSQELCIAMETGGWGSSPSPRATAVGRAVNCPSRCPPAQRGPQASVPNLWSTNGLSPGAEERLISTDTSIRHTCNQTRMIPPQSGEGCVPHPVLIGICCITSSKFLLMRSHVSSSITLSRTDARLTGL